MPVADHLGEKLEEEGEQQQADVHAIDVGIGGDDDSVIAQVFNAVLDVERGLEQGELLVFIHDLARQRECVERLAAE